MTTQLPKPSPKGHTTVTFRSFKHFSETNFLFDLSQQPFRNVYNHCHQEKTLTVWYDSFKTVIDRHAPVQLKRIKKKKKKKKKDVTVSVAYSGISSRNEKRDQLKRNRQFDEYKKQINCVSNQAEKAKRKYFSQLVTDKTNVSSIWKAINVRTHKNRSYNTSAVNIPPDSLNDHFLSLPSSLLQSVMGNSDPDGYFFLT